MSNEIKNDGDNFLSRWSRRKVEAKVEVKVEATGEVLPAKSAEPSAGAPPQRSSTGAPSGVEMPETPHPEPGSPARGDSKALLPPIDSLTHEGDFTPFMAKDIDPALRNQAMKKLFADPHYGFDNMDKLDIYIDDYSKSEPIPLDVLKKMYQSKSLFLFSDEEESAAAPELPPASTAPAPATPADAPVNEAEKPLDADTHTVTVGNDDDSSGTAPHVALPHRSTAQ